MAVYFKTMRELDAMRAKQAPAISAAIKAQRLQQPLPYEDVLFLVVSKVPHGSKTCGGLFAMSQLITNDKKGKELKRPERKLLIRDVQRDGIEREFASIMHKVFFT